MAKAYLGDWVESKRYGHQGRVYRKHQDYFSTGNGPHWFELQQLPAETKTEPWYSILVHGGGRVDVPESDIELLGNVRWHLHHFYADFYFGK